MKVRPTPGVVDGAAFWLLAGAFAVAIVLGHDGRRALQMLVLALPALLWLRWPLASASARRIRALAVWLWGLCFAADGAFRAYLQDIYRATPDSAMVIGAIANTGAREERRVPDDGLAADRRHGRGAAPAGRHDGPGTVARARAHGPTRGTSSPARQRPRAVAGARARGHHGLCGEAVAPHASAAVLARLGADGAGDAAAMVGPVARARRGPGPGPCHLAVHRGRGAIDG